MLAQRLLSLVYVLSLSCLMTVAQSNNYFITPPTPGPTGQFSDNNVYALGSTINLEWKTNYSTISLALWQNNNDSYALLLDSVPGTQQTLRWDININDTFNITSASLATPNVFFFQMWSIVEGGNIGDRFSTHYFNITGDQSTPAATSSAASISSATATSTNLATASTSTPATSASSSSSSSSGGLSSGATIGIGVGVGVGVACLLIGAAIGFFFWRRSKKNNTTAHHGQIPVDRSMEQAAPPYFGGSSGGYTPVQQNGTPYYDRDHMAKSQLSPAVEPSELSGEGHTHELSSTQLQSHELPGTR